MNDNSPKTCASSLSDPNSILSRENHGAYDNLQNTTEFVSVVLYKLGCFPSVFEAVVTTIKLERVYMHLIDVFSIIRAMWQC